MISSHWPAWAATAARIVALILGIAAAATGLNAARLWHAASVIDVPDYDPPLASIGDAPELHIMDAVVQLGAMRARDIGPMRGLDIEALRSSGRINARAAAWTAVASVLAGLGAFIGAL